MQNKTKLAALIALSLGAVGSVHANTITLGLDSSTNSSAGSDSDSDSDSSAVSVNSFSSANDNGNFASGSARGNDAGWFYTTASASGISASHVSSVTQSYSVTNEGDDSFFDFDFNVMNGSISVFCDDGYGDGYGDGNDRPDFDFPIATATSNVLAVDPQPVNCSSRLNAASLYEANITLDGNVVWSSEASLTIDNNELSFDESGTQSLGTYNGGGFFGWGSQSFNIDLGLIAAGQTFDLIYSVTATSTMSLDDPLVFFNDAFIVDGRTQFGDPNGFNQFSANIFTATPANVVNTPGTIALFGLALVGAAGMSRRKVK
ncbi:hypothetical protein [Glaciecola petra]|uniref:PEP-CTERM sorting domain-containing protein n=1 Tax=Glaciecola petra TaxID=3075602 RepID=A0ABU2ZQ53_9ALTE|nr:hypothetical protein [Aestuariibacter sp. P117]MDT0594732.1 hypothetical protein [Aestuariibacter sp. P117]